jgi:hypothetical protein
MHNLEEEEEDDAERYSYSQSGCASRRIAGSLAAD